MPLRVFSDEEYNLIWDRIFAEFEFKPLYKDWKDKEWIKLSMPSKVYKISDSCWDENTEKRLNGIFETVATGSIYALDYMHDCFEYNPSEHIPYDYSYHDDERNCNVYFPSYYPNGDYHFFIDKNWKFGMLGHPWKKEIAVWGEELIKRFDDDKLANSIYK